MNDNKLIAEFMGMKEHHQDSSMLIYKVGSHNNYHYINELKYHSSWDWLMPVLRKCEDIRLSSSGLDINYDRIMTTIHNRLIQVDLLSTYNNIVEFIKWYNEQEKSK